MKIKTLFTTWLCSTSLLFAQGEGQPNTLREAGVKTLVESFASNYSQLLKATVENYNAHTARPQELTKDLVRPEDQTGASELLKSSGTKKLPKFEYKDGSYEAKVGEDRLSIDVVSSFEGKMLINNKVFIVPLDGSWSERIARTQQFFIDNGIKTTSSTPFTPLDLFFPKAEAFICGGLCIAALIGGTVVVGGMAYAAAKSILGGSNDHKKLQGFQDQIIKKRDECRKELNDLENYDSHLRSYSQVTPGAFSSFELMKKVVVDQDDDAAKLSAHLYTALGAKEFTNCQQFSDALIKSMSVAQKRAAQVDDFMGNASFCNAHQELIDCLEAFSEVHRTHQGRRNIYDKRYNDEKGVYDESESFSGQGR
jgi:hypothetical protein